MNAQAQPAGNTATPPSFLLRVKGFALPNAEATPRQHSNTPEPVAGVAKALPPPVATPVALDDAAGGGCCQVADPLSKRGYWTGYQWCDFNVSPTGQGRLARLGRADTQKGLWTAEEHQRAGEKVDRWLGESAEEATYRRPSGKAES